MIKTVKTWQVKNIERMLNFLKHFAQNFGVKKTKTIRFSLLTERLHIRFINKYHLHNIYSGPLRLKFVFIQSTYPQKTNKKNRTTEFEHCYSHIDWEIPS